MNPALSPEVAQTIQDQVYELLTTNFNHTFEEEHIRLVEKYAIELAYIRNLDIPTAQVIALLHDHGRLIESVYGKAHAKAGAKVAKKWLAPFNIPPYSLEIIIDAIGCHNKKKLLQGPYQELIKDSDSLAHRDAFGNDLPEHEAFRIKDAYLPQLRLKFAKTKKIQSVLERRLTELDKTMKTLSKDNIPNKKVHKFRICIRRIRAILWLNKKNTWSKEENKLNDALKKSFKDFEDVRRLAVFLKTLKDLQINDGLPNLIKVRINKEKKHIQKIIKEHRSLIIKCREPLIKFSTQQGGQKISIYKNVLKAASLEDINSLHELRIVGKNLKYLIEESILINCSKEDIAMISDLHKTIGQLNDIEENRLLLATFIDTSDFEAIKTHANTIEVYMSNKEIRLKRDIDALLFRMKKRWR